MEFDPYYKWLGIPPEDQPPNYYQLLSIREFESDADVIENAAERQMAHVRKFASGPNGDASQQLLNELAHARNCLLSMEKRATYDERLRMSSATTFSPIARPDEETNKQPIVVTPVQPNRYRPAAVLVVGLIVLVSGFLLFKQRAPSSSSTMADPDAGLPEWEGDPEEVVRRLNLESDFNNVAEMKMTLIAPGEFRRREKDEKDYEIVQTVRITTPFYISATEVTRQQFAKVSSLPDIQGIARDYPQAQVTWHEAVEFCQQLNKQNRRPRLRYRLPTEAEWEYAARAGSDSDYFFGDDVAELSNYAWFHTDGAHPVGEKKPNKWGLFDMHGNVGEWCSDWHEPYESNLAIDPTGPDKGTVRVFRGGSWFDTAGTCSLNFRGFASPKHQDRQLGIRVVAEIVD